MATRRPTPNFTWDVDAQRYRDRRGRFVPEARVNRALDGALRTASDRAERLTRRLTAGEIDVREWRAGMRAIVKETQLYSAAAARGGWAQMTPTDFGRVGANVRKQYAWLERFARELSTGRAITGADVRRARMYANAGRVSFYQAAETVARDRGMEEERNRLGSAEHCGDCLAETARGWVPIGSLKPIGSRKCLSSCHCRREFRRAPS